MPVVQWLEHICLNGSFPQHKPLALDPLTMVAGRTWQCADCFRHYLTSGVLLSHVHARQMAAASASRLPPDELRDTRIPEDLWECRSFEIFYWPLPSHLLTCDHERVT